MHTGRALRPLILLTLVAGFVFPLFAQQDVVVRGADSMLLLAQRWSERLSEIFPRARLQVNGGGTAQGIAQLTAGRAEVAQLPRRLSLKERAGIESRTGHPVLEFPVAIESVTVAVNASNPVSELTVAQLREIYTGHIDNWSKVGGRNQPIQLYSTEAAAGGSLFFREIVLGNEEFDYAMRGFSSDRQMMETLAHDANGIGFGPLANTSNTKLLRIRRSPGSAAVQPNATNIRTDAYPLSRYLYWTLRQPMDGNVKQIASWVLSSEGQLYVEGVGYYPLTPQDRGKGIAQLVAAH
jgi:phosphate transport system substrate-binding protein